MTPKKLWKTTMVVWTDYDPANSEIADLARDATNGPAYCSKQESVLVPRVKLDQDPDWDGTEFFDPTTWK